MHGPETVRKLRKEMNFTGTIIGRKQKHILRLKYIRIDYILECMYVCTVCMRGLPQV